MAPLDHALAGAEARNVHAERSAERDVQELRTATGGKQRLVRGDGGAQERQLKGIALRAEQGGVVGGLVAPERGTHVGSPRHGDAVGTVDILADDALVLGEGHHKRQAAGGENRIDKAVGDCLLRGNRLRALDDGGLPARGDKNNRSSRHA